MSLREKWGATIHTSGVDTNKLNVDNDHIRKAYFEMEDGLAHLEQAMDEDSVTSGDKELKRLFANIGKAETVFYKYLDKKYNWD